MGGKVRQILTQKHSFVDIYRLLVQWTDRADAFLSNQTKRLRESPIARLWNRFCEKVPITISGFFVAAILIATRQWSLFQSPQFRFEDGPEFFQNAYNGGFSSLTLLHAGYFHTIPRLVALMAARFPVGEAPLVMSVFAVAIQAWSAAFMLSGRLADTVKPSWIRGVLWFLIIAHPNSEEMRANMAHAQWYLALIAVAMLCATPPKSVGMRVWEVFAMLLIAVTGPFAIVLAPLAWLGSRQSPHRQWLAGSLTVGALVTIPALILHPRFASPGTKRFWTLRNMIASKLLVGSFQGMQANGGYGPTVRFDLSETVLCFALLGLTIWAMCKGGPLLRWLFVVGLVSFLASLSSGASWMGLAVPGQGERYFFALGVAAIAATLALLCRQKRGVFHLAAIWVGYVVIVGVLNNWRDRPIHIESNLQSQIPGFDRAPVGHIYVLYTSGDQASRSAWPMKLLKH
jgi:hypothetical protein